MRNAMIDTAVCIDDMLGPFECKLDPHNRWNGWMSPHFPLASARKLSERTVYLAEDGGYDGWDTIHVIDGRADGPDTVHIIESDMTREVNEDGDREPLAIAVRVPWGSLDRGAEATISYATPAARKAARRSATRASRLKKRASEKAARVIFVHVRWMYLGDDLGTANIVEPDRDGLYPIGGWEWTWSIASWWCPCAYHNEWHELECEKCGASREDRPKTPLAIATALAGQTLRGLVPEATSALVDLTSLGHICQVFAGDTEVDTADDSGPYDTETLGAADTILRQALVEDDDLTAAGWEHAPDPQSERLYRITFPAAYRP
ncbi:hypothetical protein ABZ923_39845 [Streptomyces sp. NPDC046881]|uniref:hypothetical protein n=1 Tax=Streptomyces sp. NPDC046881 TaxID=3155374 RepID=UPI0033E8526C